MLSAACRAEEPIITGVLLGTSNPTHYATHLLRDRDQVYGQIFTRRMRAVDIRDQPTSPRSPWQNAMPNG